MYSLPSASKIWEPSPRAIKGGFPPTLRKARTGEFTPPGMMRCARWNNCSDLAWVKSQYRRPITPAAALRAHQFPPVAPKLGGIIHHLTAFFIDDANAIHHIL